MMGKEKGILPLMKSVLLATVLLGLVGCDAGRTSSGVAVLDLDAVAKAVGQDKNIAEQVQAFAQSQEQKLRDLKEELEQQVNSASAKLGQEPTPDDAQSLNAMVTDARTQLTRELGQARQSAQSLRSKLVRDFAAEMQPIAQKIALQRGLSIVMVKQPGLLVVAPEADITSAVIQALQPAPKSIVPPLPGTR